MNYPRILRYLAGYIAVYHMVLGILGIMASHEFTRQLIAVFFDAKLPIDDTLFYVVKFICAYMTAFGFMMLLIAINPFKYRSFAFVGAAFFLIRLVELIYFYSFIGKNFNIPDNRILVKIFIIAILGAALAFLGKKIKGDGQVLV